MKQINVALVGIGNAASALAQSTVYYGTQDKVHTLPLIGGLAISDIKVVAAFDIAEGKVGHLLKDAMFAEPNKCPRYVEIPKGCLEVIVKRGPTKDGISDEVSDLITESKAKEADVAAELKAAGAEILICLIPTGSNDAVKYYAQAALDANCAFINATPTIIASDRAWALKFKQANLPLVGDDLQSLAGGTRIHKGVLQLLNDTMGVRISNTYQLDVSGGAEGKNTLDANRKWTKREIKSESIQRILPHLTPDNIASGTTDYLDFLGNLRHGFFYIEGKSFMESPVIIDMKIKTFDGPNGAATLVDVIRATKIALDRATDGPLISVSAYGFKHPPVFYKETEATQRFKDFCDGRIFF